MTDAQNGLIAGGFGYPGCEPRGELLGPQWAAKKVALLLFAMFRFQESRLRWVHHAFGDYPLFEAGAHGDKPV